MQFAKLVLDRFCFVFLFSPVISSSNSSNSDRQRVIFSKYFGTPVWVVLRTRFYFTLIPRDFLVSMTSSPLQGYFSTPELLQFLCLSLFLSLSLILALPIGHFFHVLNFLTFSKDSYFYSYVTHILLTAYFISQTLLAKFLFSDLSNIPFQALYFYFCITCL
jgi:hypothetical protein